MFSRLLRSLFDPQWQGLDHCGRELDFASHSEFPPLRGMETYKEAGEQTSVAPSFMLFVKERKFR